MTATAARVRRVARNRLPVAVGVVAFAAACVFADLDAGVVGGTIVFFTAKTVESLTMARGP
ncbi:hypothetical protein [Halarchaeum nitratireducens]|uniref:Uncharacterized protein n=1 Tax=Halarchaeum nitratireducens TaxID=489913 RepID=A0A830GED6_9EURY|nr:MULTISPECIES: hypothetical protein [Halarchaeum]MBP2251011.1 hypothetical protein [Halarchaeum solikamskense]GGN21642.1 hypothetical protein GCM10009021_23740 [Halarchaeum nitratireducens]